MFRIIITSFLLIALNTNCAQNNTIYNQLLKDYVKNGLVNYKELKNDRRLDNYLETISKSNPMGFKKNEKLAFWSNAYNAFTLKVVAENYPIESITELHTGGRIIGYLLGKTVWDKKFITINKRKYSLNYIEHKILRKMNDPRIHFAIVCASISCPILRNEAYAAEKIDEQLNEQTALFMNDATRNYFDVKHQKAHISKIFSWFSEDFGDSDKKILKFIAKYLPEQISKNIITNINNWDIIYNDYDWGLNDSKK